MISNNTRRKIFGRAKGTWPELSPESRLEKLRSLAFEINPAGGHSLSALNEEQAESLIAKLGLLWDKRRRQLASDWNNLFNDLNFYDDQHSPYATRQQFYRLKAIALDTMMSTSRVEAILTKRCNISSLRFSIPKKTMSQLLTIMESYRKQAPTHYYQS